MVRPTIILAGYSLGARHVISMAACLPRPKKSSPRWNFSILAVNPPLSLVRASQVLDESLAYAKEHAVETLSLGLYFLFAQQLHSGDVDIDRFLSSEHAEHLKQRAAKFIPPVEGNSELLKTLISSVFDRKLKETAANVIGHAALSDANFFRSLVAQSKMGVDSLSRPDLALAREETRGRFLIYHSRDDFLVQPEELARLQSENPGHVTVHDSGGHVGVIFQDDYLSSIDESSVFR